MTALKKAEFNEKEFCINYEGPSVKYTKQSLEEMQKQYVAGYVYWHHLDIPMTRHRQ
jgi:hypothetical protein